MIDAHFYDGQTSQRHPVTVVFENRAVTMRGTGLRRVERLSRLRVSERLERAPRILRFADGAFIEISHRSLDRLLRANGYRDPWVVRWQQNWFLSLSALIVVLALLISAYQWGVPWAADNLAQHLPVSIERKIGDKGLELMEEQELKPSKLDPSDQARLHKLFADMKQPRGEKTPYRLEMRSTRPGPDGIGPNAFALPNGVIVLTDELVKLAANDTAILGVLSHELGHIQRRHMSRKILQTVGVGVILNVVVGDLSSVLTTLPTVLLNQKYSRDFEREADQYAIDMMLANRLPLSPMAAMFEKMQAMSGDKPAPSAKVKKRGASDDSSADTDSEESEENASPRKGKSPDKKKTESDDSTDYFKSHPTDVERMAKLRAADAALAK
ncbi:M48 family metallopeptidase [soil metagenome]